MKNLFYLFFLTSFVVFACNNSNNSANQSGADSTATAAVPDDDVTEFINEMLQSGAMEIELGELAQTKAQNPQVKAFGAMMVRDHTAAGDELKVIAAKKNIVTAQVLNANHLDEVEKLKQETGANFDKKYMDMIVSAHKKDIDEFEDMAKDDEDPDLKAFAAKTLPKLKMHLDSANAIQKAIK